MLHTENNLFNHLPFRSNYFNYSLYFKQIFQMKIPFLGENNAQNIFLCYMFYYILSTIFFKIKRINFLLNFKK